MMVASVILFLITTAMAKHHHGLGPNDNFFGTVNVAIHSVVDDIFESFNLGSNFANATNSKLLLTMHHDLSNIADKTFETFNDIQKTVKDNIYNQSELKYLPKETEEDAIKLDNIVREILNKNNFDVYSSIKGTLYKRAKDKTKDSDKDKTQVKVKRRKIKITPAFDDSEEFTEFVINFLKKVNNLTIQDFKKSSRHGRFVVPSKKNLKVWDEPSSLKYDLDKSDITRRIFKGSKARLEPFPFIVSIHIMGEFYCSGCIISRGFVITAASCLNIAYKNDFFKRNLKSIYVRMGSAHTSRDGETIPVQNVYFHPEYEPEHLVNNLAIIELEKRIRFSKQQQRFRRILWDKTPGALSNDTKTILILGWGSAKGNQSTQNLSKLSVSKLDVYNTDACTQNYTEDLIRKENFCAALKEVNGSSCSGDAGGPGIVNAVLVGVVSFGAPECGAAGSPTVFTKLGYYVPWIESVVNAHHKINETNDNIDTRRKNMRSKQFKVERSAMNNQIHGRIDDYPEDVKALRDTLMELVKSDQTVIDDAIYGDTHDEFSKFFQNQYQIEEDDPQLYQDDPQLYQDDTESLIEFKFEFDAGSSPEQEEETPTETPDYLPMFSMFTTSKKMSLRKPPTDSDYETGNHAVRNDFTDNYEESSKDEHEISFEVPKSFKKNSPRNKKVVSIQSEGRSDRRNSDKSNDYSEEIKEFYVKQQKHSEKRNSNKKTIGKSVYLSGAQIDVYNVEEASSTDIEKENPKKVVMKHNRLSNHASSVLDEGKSLATKNVFIDAKVNYDKHKNRNSRTDKAKRSSSKKRKDKSKSSHKKYFINHEQEGSRTFFG